MRHCLKPFSYTRSLSDASQSLILVISDPSQTRPLVIQRYPPPPVTRSRRRPAQLLLISPLVPQYKLLPDRAFSLRLFVWLVPACFLGFVCLSAPSFNLFAPADSLLVALNFAQLHCIVTTATEYCVWVQTALTRTTDFSLQFTHIYSKK